MATKAKAEAASPPVEYACGMDKIRDELAKDSRQYVQVVGEFLTGYLLKHPEAEEKIMAQGKSIAGSLRAMEDAARKMKQGSVAVLDDRTAFGIVLGYFGIEDGEDEGLSERQGPHPPATQAPSPEGKAFGDGDATLMPSPGGASSARETAQCAVSSETGPAGPWTGGPTRSVGSDEVPVAPADPFDLDALMGVL